MTRDSIETLGEGLAVLLGLNVVAVYIHHLCCQMRDRALRRGRYFDQIDRAHQARKKKIIEFK